MGILFFISYCFCFCGFVWLWSGGGFLVDFCFFLLGGSFGFSFVFDWVSVGFFCVVSFVSCFVFFFCDFYMGGGFDLKRFFYLLSLFVASMGVLIFGGSFLVSMIGWDGLGVTSFALVIFYGSGYSLDSGLVTVFSNRLGDVFFLLSFFWMVVGGVFYPEVLGLSSGLVLFLVFFGCMTKSAQLPFSSWLPFAMAAPTPVSSLVHSSTLVTAGVYILVRYNFLFFHSLFVFSVSLSTFFLAGLGAFVERDFKKIVAMSTLSQLGFMVFCVSVGLWKVCFFHMVLHAIFKSMLFLSCGFMMASFFGAQDSRFFGGSFSPVASVGFFTSCISLSGVPFSVGFYTKDCVIVGVGSGFFGLFSFVLFAFSCLFSVGYSVRLVFLGFGFAGFGSSFVFSDSMFHLFCVFFLWCLGVFSGFFCSFVVFDSLVFFSFSFDFLFGLFFLIFSVLVFVWVVFSYFLFSIGGSRYFSMGGVSSGFFFGSSFWGGEFSWLEVLGGKGIYSLFSLFSCFYRYFYFFGVFSFVGVYFFFLFFF